MTQRIDQLLQSCTVKITVPGQVGWGTGCFVAPGLILTCAHVVKSLTFEATAQIRWQQQENWASAELVQLLPKLDLALLQFTSPEAVPCVYLDEELQVGHELYCFGYPDQDFPNGCPVTGNCEGFTGDLPTLIKFKSAQVRPGMSGAALLNRNTGKVCGVVKFTRDPFFDLSGSAIPTYVVLEQFPQLRELQQWFHESDARWKLCITAMHTQQSEGIESQIQPIAQQSQAISNVSISGSNSPFCAVQAKGDVTLNQTSTTVNYYSLLPDAGASARKIDFQPYLRSILDDEDYQKWQALYMPLRVEKVKPKEKQDGERKESAQWNALEGLHHYASNHVLLMGKPGSGKSTALQQLLWKEAQTALAAIVKGETDFKIPILIELRDCKEEAMVNRIHEKLRRRMRLDIAAIEELLMEGRFLLFFDGLNEIPNPAIWPELRDFQHERDFRKNPRIFTTRELGVETGLGIETKLTILPLTEPQIRAFVENHLPGRANSLLHQLKDRLHELAETPLLLKILCDVVKDSPNGHLPTNRGDLFRQEFARRYQAFKPKHGYVSEDSRRLTERLLQQLAFKMIQGHSPKKAELQILKDQVIQILQDFLKTQDEANTLTKASEYLEDLLKWDLLQVASDNTKIEFHHQLFQEYYAAEYLWQQLPTLLADENKFKQDYLNYLKWKEPIALMLSLVEDRKQAFQVVKLAINDVDLALGARLVGGMRQDWQNEAVTFLLKQASEQQVSSTYEIQLLGKTHSDYAVPVLLEKLLDEEDLALEIAVALRELGSRSAVQKLLPNLNSSNKTIAVYTLFILGKLGYEEIIPDLRKVLTHLDNDIRVHAVEALDELNSDSAVLDFLNALNDKSYMVQQKAVEALGNLRNKSAIPALLKITLEDQSIHLPWMAAEALKKSDPEQATEELLKALKNENYEIREKAAEGLGEVGSEMAIDGLIEALEDGVVNWQVARALVEIGGKKALPGLFELLEHPIAAEQAAFVLGELGDHSAAPHLIASLNHGHSPIQERAVEALGKLGDETAVPRLYELLQDNLRDNSSGNNLRKGIVVALGKLGDERVRPELVEILEDQAFGSASAWLGQWQVFDALEKIGGQPVVQALNRAISARSTHIRWKSAEVLGNLGDEVAIDSLLTALSDENSAVRRQATEALGKFKSQQVMPKLSPLLVHKENPNAREAAVQVLGYLKDESAVTALLDALSDPEAIVRYNAANSLARLSHSEIELGASKALSERRKRKLLNDGFVYSVQDIQENCRFYNYEIAHNLLPQGRSIALYFSSAPSDAELQTQLANHLNLLERKAIITSWHHRQMLPGDERAQVINDRLNSADIILLLISADSIADRTCYDIEINRAMERHRAGEARVIPILLRPVNWQGAPFSHLPVLPKNHQPVTSWGDRDAAFQEIAAGIREVALKLRKTKPPGQRE